jgi:hypothetical protein
VAGTAVVRARQGHPGRSLKRKGVFDLGDAAAVQSVEDALAILVANLVQQFVGADGACLGAGVVSEKSRHRLRELAAIDDAGWNPFAGASNRTTQSPSPGDDDEITPTEDRSSILARDADAVRRFVKSLPNLSGPAGSTPCPES